MLPCWEFLCYYKMRWIIICLFDTKIVVLRFQSYIRGELSVLGQLLAAESLLDMMKNASYFTLKDLFVLKIFKFLSWLFVLQKDNLITKLRLISKFMTSNLEKTFAIYILPSISRNKGNDTINIFLKKS